MARRSVGALGTAKTYQVTDARSSATVTDAGDKLLAPENAEDFHLRHFAFRNYSNTPLIRRIRYGSGILKHNSVPCLWSKWLCPKPCRLDRAFAALAALSERELSAGHRALAALVVRVRSALAIAHSPHCPPIRTLRLRARKRNQSRGAPPQLSILLRSPNAEGSKLLDGMCLDPPLSRLFHLEERPIHAREPVLVLVIRGSRAQRGIHFPRLPVVALHQRG